MAYQQRGFEPQGGAQGGIDPRRERELTLRQIDNMSTSLINFGKAAVVNNPRKLGLWVIGLCLCLFFTGFEVPQDSYDRHRVLQASIKHEEIWDAEDAMLTAKRAYDRRRGWFWSCNEECQAYKMDYELKGQVWKALDDNRVSIMRSANAEIGLLSTEGITHTREKFWDQFSKGQRFASRQSKWDAFFMGLSALQKNEKIGSYLLRIFANFIFNVTLGLIMAVVTFWCCLWGILVEYKAPILTSLLYVLGAVVASASFFFTAVVILYVGAAGTVYVGAKVLATSVRIEDGNRGRHHLRDD